MSDRKVDYDFREGLDSSKVVYRNKSRCNCKDFWSYAGYLLATWLWAAAWFALFLYAWLTDRYASFVAFLTIWCVFMAILIFGFFVPNLVRYNHQVKVHEEAIRKEEEEKERKYKEAIAGVQASNDARPANQEKELNEIKQDDKV